MDQLAAALASSFHVWALDFRGHGDSTAPDDGDFSWIGMGGDALTAINAISDGGDAGVVAVGHSLGGAALLLAERRTTWRVALAYLYEPIIYPGNLGIAGHDNPMAVAARRRRRTFPSKGAALLRYASRTPLGVLRADALLHMSSTGSAMIPKEPPR